MAKYVGYKRPKDTKKTMKHFLTYLGHYKWAFFLVAILVFISAGAGICGTYLIKPLVNNFIVPGNMKGLLLAVIGMGVMYLCGALATLGYNRLMVHTSQKVVSEIRMDLFRHTQKLPLKYFDDNTRGEIMSHFTNDVDTVQEAMNNSFAMIIQSFLTLFGTITMMMVLSVKLTMLVVVFLVITFLFMQYNGKCSKKYYHRQQQELGNINGFVQEMMAGQKVEKVFNHEKENFKEFCEMNERFRRESTNALAHSGMLVPVIVALSYFNYALSACAGGMFVIRGLMDLGSLSAYLVYVRQSAMPLNQFTQQVNFLLSALSGAERIFDMMDETEEIDEGKVTLCNVCKNADGTLTECAEITGLYAWKLSSGELVLLKGDVRFHDVVFGYVSEKTVLNGISLFAKPGQKIAFVGSTGAGKTTIVNLINRFYDIQDGKIRYDRIHSLLEKVGREHLILDVSCRKKDGKYYIVTDRWQKFTEETIRPELLEKLAGCCQEMLVHAVNVEGTRSGVDIRLIEMLAQMSEVPVTYAGGIGSMEDLEQIRIKGQGRVHFTVGSALDLFGGSLSFEKVVECAAGK